MLSKVDPRNRVPRPVPTPRRVWRLSDPSALSRLSGRAPAQSVVTPTPVPWIRTQLPSLTAGLPNLEAKIPRELPPLVDVSVEVDIDELAKTRESSAPKVLEAVTADLPTQRALPESERPPARTAMTAHPDVNQLVKLEVETRQRLQAEVERALAEAVDKVGAQRNRTAAFSAFSWMFLGLALGSLAVYVLMVRAHASAPPPVVMAPMSTSPVAAMPPPPPAPAPVCVAPEIAPVVQSVPSALPLIPTFSVNDLPKPKPKLAWTPPKAKAVAKAAPTADEAPPEAAPMDDDNPYDDGSK